MTTTTTEYLLVIMAQMISITLEKMNVPPKEVEKFTEQIKDRKV